jgi:hypothetical protein
VRTYVQELGLPVPLHDVTSNLKKFHSSEKSDTKIKGYLQSPCIRKHRKIDKDLKDEETTNENARTARNTKIKSKKKSENNDWPKEKVFGPSKRHELKVHEASISIGQPKGGVSFRPSPSPSSSCRPSSPRIGRSSRSDSERYGSAEERLIKEKGLSPGPKKWYAIEKKEKRTITNPDLRSMTPHISTPYEFARSLRTMEGSTTPYEFARSLRTMEGSITTPYDSPSNRVTNRTIIRPIQTSSRRTDYISGRAENDIIDLMKVAPVLKRHITMRMSKPRVHHLSGNSTLKMLQML